MSISNLLTENDYKIFAENITLGNPGATGSAPLDTNISSVFSSTAIGPFNANVTGFFRVVGGMAVLQINNFTGNSVADVPITFGTSVPIPPISEIRNVIGVQRAGTNTTGTVQIDASGNITIYVGQAPPPAAGSGFGAGAGSVYSFCTCYATNT